MVPEILYLCTINVPYLFRVTLFEMLRNTDDVTTKLLTLSVAKMYSTVNVCFY